ncbi:DUF1573 domain-containing protein [Irregularibacter muris]|uniref:DUF1573 domain-containing protein n=1 Tax=Irregularibacter muris TaxID=1796619 RepID=A0AAE3KZS6_9FIRM|nr:DUF1573 domain-containing protein [Irregularibacter muris]MCR1898712.1 DUF1573 domain-containing protein [Irregularibacter muris]
MKDVICDQFQDTVSQLLIKHKSILDVLTKQQESSTRVNRAIVKAVTSCGCVEIHAIKQEIGDEISMENIHEALNNHVKGQLCEQCREVVEQELGNHLFYIAALCNSLDLNLLDIILKEKKKINTLGIYNMLR